MHRLLRAARLPTRHILAGRRRVKPASNLLSPCMRIARLGKRDLLIQILSLFGRLLAGLSRTVRETRMIPAKENAHM